MLWQNGGVASEDRKPGKAEQLRNFIANSSGWTLLWASLSVGITFGIVTFFTTDGGFAVGGWPQFWFDVFVMGAFVGTIVAGFAIVILADIYERVVDGILNRRSERAERLPRPLVRYRPRPPDKQPPDRS